MNKKSFEPKLLTVLREGYSSRTFLKDLTSGTIVGIVALPLAIAFGIASGVKPEQGLFTAIIAGFIISVFSGSRFQIGGPTGAFIVIVYGIIQQYGYEGLAAATVMAGILLVLMGMAKFGTFIRFIPYPVTIGFTSGIAVIIFVGQLRDFLGLQINSLPAGLIDKIICYACDFKTFNPWVPATGIATIVIILVCNRFFEKFPSSLIAIVITSLVTAVFKLPVDNIGSRFGTISGSLPFPEIPWEGLKKAHELIMPALSIACLAGVESLLSAVVADGMTGRRHRPNMELIAQGLGNIASPLFAGIPATGAIARTATNIRNGGQTPVAGIVHAVVLLLILLFLGKWAAYIPMASLAGILILVAWNMSEYKMFIRLLRSPKSDIIVLLSTFLLTVLLDLTVAIPVGMVLAAFLFMRRMADVSRISTLPNLCEEEEEDMSRVLQNIPPGIEIFEVNGPFFFGASEKFSTALRIFGKAPRVLIIRMRNVPVMDATGIFALENVCEDSRKKGILVLLSGVQKQPREVLVRAGFVERFGRDKLCVNIEQALSRASKSLASHTKH
jgi:SulP family sulfate permease